jgi:hypothetical protein
MAEDRLLTSVLPPGVADLNLRKYFSDHVYLPLSKPRPLLILFCFGFVLCEIATLKHDFLCRFRRLHVEK